MAPHARDTAIISAYYIQAELITFTRHVTDRIRVFAINPIDWCITEILVTENDKRRYCELNGHEAQPVCITSTFGDNENGKALEIYQVAFKKLTLLYCRRKSDMDINDETLLRDSSQPLQSVNY